MKHVIGLRNWAVIGLNPDPYQAPEVVQLNWQLVGQCFGHPKHEDGKPVAISRPVAYDRKNRVIETRSGNRYFLGRPHPNYEQGHRNASERVHKRLCMLPRLRIRLREGD